MTKRQFVPLVLAAPLLLLGCSEKSKNKPTIVDTKLKQPESIQQTTSSNEQASSGPNSANSSVPAHFPQTDFQEVYSVADFHFSQDVEYWEIRQGDFLYEQEPSDPANFKTIAQFDANTYQMLYSEQMDLLKGSTTESGFGVRCRPSYCPIYGATLAGESVTLIDSEEALIKLFGEIDTEAEVYVLLTNTQLYAASSKPLKYREESDGFLVWLSWSSLCEISGEDLVKVHRDGTIETIQEIEYNIDNWCI